jgi:hypothetical protein
MSGRERSPRISYGARCGGAAGNSPVENDVFSERTSGWAGLVLEKNLEMCQNM